MPGRSYSAGNQYRYGFNGKEQDNEVSGQGNQYDYGFRIYNPRLGKFLSVDPLTKSYPYFTPYQFAGNMPIAAIDLDGSEQYVVIYHKDQAGKTGRVSIYAMTDEDNNLLNQNVQKVVHNQRDGNNVALGNVLVFEIANAGTKNEQMNIVDKRNIADSKLTKEEEKIFNENKKQYEESLGYQFFGYPDETNPNYKSDQFLTNNSNAFEATSIIEIIEHPIDHPKVVVNPDATEVRRQQNVFVNPLENSVDLMKSNIDRIKQSLIKKNKGLSNIKSTITIITKPEDKDFGNKLKNLLRKEGIKVILKTDKKTFDKEDDHPEQKNDIYYKIKVTGEKK